MDQQTNDTAIESHIEIPTCILEEVRFVFLLSFKLLEYPATSEDYRNIRQPLGLSAQPNKTFVY